MPDDIGLSELITKVKEELLQKDDLKPMFKVEEVVLELQVIVNKSGDGKVKIGVPAFGVEGGLGVGKELLQNIKVTLKPIKGKTPIKGGDIDDRSSEGIDVEVDVRDFNS